jgi:hypothetical protein
MLRDAVTPRPSQAAVALLAGRRAGGLPDRDRLRAGRGRRQRRRRRRIFAAKGRPSDHPLIVHVRRSRRHPALRVRRCPRSPGGWSAFWPGPLTVILPRHPGVGSGRGRAGLHRPALPQPPGRAGLAAAVRAAPCRRCFGLAAPSANQFGRVSPTTAAHVQAEFGDGCWCSMAAPATSASNPPSSTAPAAGRCCCGPGAHARATRGGLRRAGAAAARTCPTPRRARPARWRRTTRRGPGCA